MTHTVWQWRLGPRFSEQLLVVSSIRSLASNARSQNLQFREAFGGERHEAWEDECPNKLQHIYIIGVPHRLRVQRLEKATTNTKLKRDLLVLLQRLDRGKLRSNDKEVELTDLRVSC